MSTNPKSRNNPGTTAGIEDLVDVSIDDDSEITWVALPWSEIVTAYTLQLRNGRQLSFAESGSGTGTPFLWLPGLSGLSSVWCTYYHQIADEADIRLIVPDRPGMGRSTGWTKQERERLGAGLTTLVDLYVQDLAMLICELGLRDFGILADTHSTPYALYAAKCLQQHICNYRAAHGDDSSLQEGKSSTPGTPKLGAVGIISALVPRFYGESKLMDPARALFNFTIRVPASRFLSYEIFYEGRSFKRHDEREIVVDVPDGGPRSWIAELPRSELDGESEFKGPRCNSKRSISLELDTFLRAGKTPWGFDIRGVGFRANDGVGVRLFYGGMDKVRSPTVYQAFARDIPNGKLVWLPGATRNDIDNDRHLGAILAEMKRAMQV